MLRPKQKGARKGDRPSQDRRGVDGPMGAEEKGITGGKDGITRTGESQNGQPATPVLSFGGFDRLENVGGPVCTWEVGRHWQHCHWVRKKGEGNSTRDYSTKVSVFGTRFASRSFGVFLVVDWSGVTNISNSNFDCDEIWGKKE